MESTTRYNLHWSVMILEDLWVSFYIITLLRSLCDTDVKEERCGEESDVSLVWFTAGLMWFWNNQDTYSEQVCYYLLSLI